MQPFHKTSIYMQGLKQIARKTTFFLMTLKCSFSIREPARPSWDLYALSVFKAGDKNLKKNP